MRFMKIQCVSPVSAIVLGLSLLLLVGPAEAQRGGGKGGPGGGRRGGGLGQVVQQRPGKPAAERFLRVCRVLSLEEGQLESAKAAYDSMQVEKNRVIEDQRLGAISSLAAKQALKKLGRRFEGKFIALLNEKQRQKLEKLKGNGTLDDQWW